MSGASGKGEWVHRLRLSRWLKLYQLEQGSVCVSGKPVLFGAWIAAMYPIEA